MPSRRLFNLSSISVSVLLLCLAPVIGSSGDALAQSGFGPEIFVRTSKTKNLFTRAFTVNDTSIPYTLTVTNGTDDGLSRIAKGTLILNGTPLIGKPLFNRRAARIVVALNPQRQNTLAVKLKGGAPGDFVRVSIEPTRSTLINDPDGGGFDDSQSGLAFPFGVVVDQATHRAYVSDKHADTVFEFDIASARIVRSFAGVDGDSAFGNGVTSGISFNRNSGTIVAANVGDPTAGSISIINVGTGAMGLTQLTDAEGAINPLFVAVNPGNNVAAFNAQYAGRARRAHFIDLSTGELVVREEDMTLSSTAYNSGADEFVFTGTGTGSPALFVYRGDAPFQRVRRIDSSARAGTGFEKVAVNPETNTAVAVNQRDSAAFIFDLASGREVARIPINVGPVGEPAADVAINPLTNMAVITSRYIPRLTVINLSTGLVTAEIPLPENTRALGVAIDHRLNRAVISENGYSSSQRNGSLFVVELPEP